MVWPNACRAVFLQNFILAFFDKGRKFNGPIIRNFDAWRCPSNAHSRDWRINLHVAGLGNFAGNEGERAFGQAKKGRVGLAVRIIDIFG